MHTLNETSCSWTFTHCEMLPLSLTYTARISTSSSDDDNQKSMASFVGADLGGAAFPDLLGFGRNWIELPLLSISGALQSLAKCPT